MGDVDGLKLINDAFGHDKGDELLQKAAAVFQNACRSGDVVARWGGDEFVFILPKTSSKEAERIVNQMKEHYANEHINSLGISISFGWDTKIISDEDIQKAIRRAEDLMYEHKIVSNATMRSNTVRTIINTLHEKNQREEQHSKRVSEMCQQIASFFSTFHFRRSILFVSFSTVSFIVCATKASLTFLTRSLYHIFSFLRQPY